MVVSGEYNYNDPVIQQQMENLTRALEASKYISSAPIYTESWLRTFLSYVNNNLNEVDVKDEKSFIKVLKDTWLSPKNSFSLDVKFDEQEEHIIASRFLIQAVNVSGTNQEKDMVKELRRICTDSPLNASVFHPYFVFFDQFELVKPTSIQCMVFGALIMMLISFIFIPNVLCCLLGRFLHYFHRAGRRWLHGPLGRQSGQHIHDQPDHVHRLQRGLHCSHLLRLHELQTEIA